MHHYRRRLWSSLVSSLVLIATIANLLSPGLQRVSAQQTEPVRPVNIPAPITTDPILPTQPDTPGSQFVADFQNGNTTDWRLSAGWSLGTRDGNAYLTTTLPGSIAIINSDIWRDVQVSADFGLEPGGSAGAAVRVGAASYMTMLDYNGQVALFKGDTLLAQGPTPEASTNSGLIWRRLTVTALGDTLTVLVDGVEQLRVQDSPSLAAGWVAFGSNTGAFALDNIVVRPALRQAIVPVPTQNLPTQVAEQTPVGEIPAGEVAAVTPEPEATVPLVESIEATDETTNTVAVDPGFSISSEASSKFSGALLTVTQAYLNGDGAGAEALANDYYMQRDSANRFRVVLWGAETSAIATVVSANSGVINRVDPTSVDAYVPLELLATLADQPFVLAITLPEQAVSTSEHAQITAQIAAQTTAQLAAQDAEVVVGQQGTGAIFPHSMDILGVNSWHLAGARGDAVNIAVIDVGFATAGSAVERTCLGSTLVENGAGSSDHGMGVVEIICDVAPRSVVWMYRATNAAELTDMVNRAARLNGSSSTNQFPQADVILIALDTGITGTDFSASINAAVANNIPVIASAGNTGNNGALKVAFSGGEGQMLINASAGSTLSFGWENASAHYATYLYHGETLIDSRTAATGSASGQYIIPASCGDACTLTLRITGEAPTSFRAQIAGGLPSSNSLVAGANLTPQASGSLTEVASLDSVISVGAVCAWQTGNGTTIPRYRILPSSSTGDPAQVKNANIKPSVVAPSRVATSISPVSPECEGGFDGTSAAAAHVAGMAALIISNPNMQGIYQATAGVPQGLKTYLQTRTIDLHAGAAADGYDNVYGAGLVQLGDPAFNLGIQQVINEPADRLAGTAYYVSTRTLPTGTEPDGSITNPFTHPAVALQRAVENNIGYVVLLPGEYVTSFAVPNPGAGRELTPLTMTSYDAVDGGLWFPSQVWVNDTFNGASGISLNGTENFVLDELQFAGSTPLYEALLPEGETSPSLQIAKITPFDLNNARNIKIINNVFRNFDAPSIIDGSQSVLIQNNTFTGYQVATADGFIDGQPVTIPLYEFTVLDIQDSGGTLADDVALRIRVEGNTFTNNSMPISNGTAFSTIQEGIIGIRRSRVDVFTSRFVNNTAESVIAINQWVEGAEDVEKLPEDIVDAPVTIFSSVFDSNTLSGSLVQLYQGNKFRFINNTVVNHNLPNAQYGSIIGLGHGETNRLAVVDHRWEIHNNLFYNNILAGSLIGHPTFSLGSDGCLPIGSNLGDPQIAARNNWFAPPFDAGECSPSVGSEAAPTNNNLYNSRFPEETGDLLIAPVGAPPEQVAASAAARAAFEAFYFFSRANDPVDPYRLRPTPDELADPQPPDPQLNRGVEAGDNAVVQAIPGYPAGQRDILGLPRILDRPPGDEATIDIGAYELGDPTPVQFIGGNGDYLLTVPEDELVVLNLGQRLVGGYQPYRFTFDNLPTVYDTNPFNACAGQPYTFNPTTYQFTYCPPPDFYNNGLTTTYPATEIKFSYTVRGLLDPATSALGPSDLEILIDPVAEDQPLNPTDDPAVFFLDPNSPLSYRLEPFADFDASGNIVLSNPDASIFAQSPDVDYFFTYSNITLNTALERFNPRIFNAAYPADPAQLTSEQTEAIRQTIEDNIGSDNVFEIFTEDGLNPVPEQFGAFEFGYTVTDNDGNTGVRTVRVRIVGEQGGTDPGDDDTGDDGDNGDPGDDPDDGDDPDGPGDDDDPGDNPGGGGIDDTREHLGMHDDSSLNFQYSEGWIPFHYADAINETLHYTVTPGAFTEFTFPGDGFNFHLWGYPQGGTYTISIDHDDDGTFTPYQQLGLTCTNSSTAATLSTARTEGFIKFTFGCSGLEALAPDEIRTIRLTNTSSSSASAVVIDAMEVREETLLPGYYDALDFALTYSTGWQTFVGLNSGPVGDSVRYTNQNGASATFFVNADLVDAFMIYRTTGDAATWGDLEVRVNGTVVDSLNGDNGAAVLAWGQAAIYPLLAAETARIDITSTTTRFVGIEAVELFRKRAALGEGFYYMDDTRIRGAGGWTAYNDPQSRTGVAYYNPEPGGSGVVFTVDATQSDRLIINHPFGTVNGFTWGSFEVCAATCTQAISQGTATARFTAVDLVDIGATGNAAVVTVNAVSGYIGLEGIQLVDTSGGLKPGYYDNIRDAYAMTYNNNSNPNMGWLHVYGSGPRGGSASWAQLGASLEFDIPAGISQVIVYHGVGQFIGDMAVCADDGTEQCTVVPDVSNDPLNYLGKAIIPAAELGLDTSVPARITIRPGTNNTEWIALVGLQLVGEYAETDLGEVTGTFIEPNDPAVRYVDSWQVFDTASARRNYLYFTEQPGAAVLFKFEGQALNVHYTSGPGAARFEVCVDTVCQVVDANRTTVGWDNVVTIDAGTSGGHIVDISSLANGWIAIEGYEIDGEKATLGLGYYNDNDPELQYTGTWTPFESGFYEGGSVRTASGASNTLSFTVNTTTAKRLVVHHPIDQPGTTPIWGTMQVCVDDTCQNVNQSTAAYDFSVFDLGSGAGVVEINPVSGFIGIEAIELLPAAGPLQPGIYNDDDYRLKYTGAWKGFLDGELVPSYTGGSLAYATSTGSISFTINADAADAIAIHHPFGSIGTFTWGSFRVCGVPATNCQTVNQGALTSDVTVIPVTAGNNPLGLTGDAAPVTIEWLSGIPGVEAIEIRGATVGMGPGYYEEDSISLALTSTQWTNFAFVSYSADEGIYTNIANAVINFEIGGGATGTTEPVTGFTTFFQQYPGAGTAEVCVTRQSTGVESCTTESTDGAGLAPFGISVYGLSPLTSDSSANETYSVQIRNASTSSAQYIIFDSVAVHGVPASRLEIDADNNAVTVDDTHPVIAYGPDALWLTGIFPGYYQDTLTYTLSAGALAQVNMRGNALTLYQLPYVGGSDEVRFCQVRGQANNRSLRCSDYALNGVGYPSSITLYGFGFGQSSIIIENRDNGGGLVLDAIQVR
ncbi:MAG: hypothetical protein OHK0046_11430 [Anaerolineae bacterium]